MNNNNNENNDFYIFVSRPAFSVTLNAKGTNRWGFQLFNQKGA